jgi:hypothetical protein
MVMTVTATHGIHRRSQSLKTSLTILLQNQEVGLYFP